jgi:hypothetical protein
MITPATHPLATLHLPNPSASSATFEVDLFVATEGPPPSFYGSATGIGVDDWPGVIWDWAAQHTGSRDTVTVPAGRSAAIPLDWPQRTPSGGQVPIGNYWAVVTATSLNRGSAVNNVYVENPLGLATTLPPQPRENCLGYPAAPTISGLPSPFLVTLEPGVSVPGAQMNFAGIHSDGRCNLTGPDPELGVLAFSNPWGSAVSWGYDVVIAVGQADGTSALPIYCSAGHASASNKGTVVVSARGVAARTLMWPRCGASPASPRDGYYTVTVNATMSAGTAPWLSSASQVVYLTW